MNIKEIKEQLLCVLEQNIKDVTEYFDGLYYIKGDINIYLTIGFKHFPAETRKVTFFGHVIREVITKKAYKVRQATLKGTIKKYSFDIEVDAEIFDEIYRKKEEFLVQDNLAKEAEFIKELQKLCKK